MSVEDNLIEEQNDHGMNQVMEDESPMQMFDLVLQGQQNKLLEGLYTKDDFYADWIQYVQAKEQLKTQNHANKCFESPFHLFLHLTLEGRESKNEEDRWIKIKAKVHLNTSLDEK